MNIVNATPGPWKAFGYEIGVSKRHLVATVYMQSGNSVGESSQEITKANARLIALAPELSDFVEKVSRSACLQQEIGDQWGSKCICFACEASRLLTRTKGQ